jgi:hypothetical protein
MQLRLPEADFSNFQELCVVILRDLASIHGTFEKICQMNDP